MCKNCFFNTIFAGNQHRPLYFTEGGQSVEKSSENLAFFYKRGMAL